MKKNKKTIIELLILFVSAILVVSFGASSFAKYVLSQHDKIEGVYVDFRLTYIGESQTAVLYEKEDQSKYEYEGTLPLSITNVKDGQTSKRDLVYTITTPTEEELDRGYVTDAWGTEYPIVYSSRHYEVSILDQNGNIPTDDKFAEMTSFEEDTPKEVPLFLKIERLIEPLHGDPEDLENTEMVSIILQTTVPYKTVQIINIKVSNSLVIIDPRVEKYFGFNELVIDINTSRTYAYSDGDYSYFSNKPSKMVFTISNGTMFDKERFLYYLENNYEEYGSSDADYSKIGYKIEFPTIESGGNIVRTDDYKITLFVPSASSLRLFLYVNNDTSVSVETYFSCNYYNEGELETIEIDYTDTVAGITNGEVYN